MRQFLLAITVTLVLTGCSTTLDAQRRGAIEGSFNRTLNVSGTLDLDVTTGSGSIDIRQGSTGRVEIHGRISVRPDRGRSDAEAEDMVRRLEANPPIEQTGSTIRIRKMPGREYENNVSLSYEIVIPAQASVTSHSGSGSITVVGITGPLNATTGSGSIRLTNIRGTVIADTGSGSIHASGIAGAFNGTTGSGSVTLAQTAAGDVDISTGSGGIEVTGVKGALRLQTGSGGISAEGEQTGRWSIATSSGGIDVRLPQNAGFDLNAHSGSGGIHVDHPISITVQGRISRQQRDISGKVRGGGYALDVRTSSGRIRIE